MDRFVHESYHNTTHADGHPLNRRRDRTVSHSYIQTTIGGGVTTYQAPLYQTCENDISLQQQLPGTTEYLVPLKSPSPQNTRVCIMQIVSYMVPGML